MERLRLALPLLGLFVALTVLATVFSGSRPATEPGVLPWALQIAGYLGAIAGGVLLLTVPGPGVHRRAGLVVLGAVVVLALLDAWTQDDLGADIGGGLVRLVCLVAVVVATVRVGAEAVSRGRRS
ncbi:hypothetical protein ACI79D_01370 [Geodermatophilus sp. SYSU D00708]